MHLTVHKFVSDIVASCSHRIIMGGHMQSCFYAPLPLNGPASSCLPSTR